MTTNANIKKVHKTFSNFANEAAKQKVPKDSIRRFLKARYIPQVQQLKFHAAARSADWIEDLEDIGFGGARGGGKTHTTFAQIALDDCQRISELKVLYLRKKAGSAVEMLKDLRKILQYTRHKATRNTITFPNGSRILIGHFQYEKDIDQYLGLEYDIIVIEEATQLTKTKIESIGTCNRSSKLNFKPRMYFTTNPGGVGHTYFKNKFIQPWRDKAEQYTKFIPSKVQDNLFNNKGYIKKLQNLSGWMRRAWLEGDWDVFVGQYFDKFRYNLHSFNPDKSNIFANGIPPGSRVWGSFDHGYQHWAVFHLFCKYDGILYVIDEMACRLTINKQIAQNIKKTLQNNNVDMKSFEKIVAGGDVFAVQSNDGLKISDEFASEGVYLSQANQARTMGASRIVSLLGDIEQNIEPSVKISQKCIKLLETLPAMEHNETKAGDVKKIDADTNGEGGDDAYDSFRYGSQEDDKQVGMV